MSKIKHEGGEVMSWPIVQLGDYCIKVGSGATPTGGASVYVNAGTALIRSQNVYNLNFDYGGLAFITDETAKKLDGVTINRDDVLLNITGDSVARTCIVPENILPARVNQHVSIVRPNTEFLLPKYLVYYLASPYMQAYMLNLAVGKGASRNALTKDMIQKFPLTLPSLREQERIISLLKPYDDLIENNRKQIKLLEEAAQRLYKEWFVDLRFPGHEDTAIVDGVPEGWEVEPLENFIAYEIGGGWGEEAETDKAENEAYVIRGTDFYSITHGNCLSIPLRYHKKSNLSARMLVDGDIIFEVSGGSKNEGVARTALIRDKMLHHWGKPVMCASFCKLIRTRDIRYSQYLYNYLQYLRTSGKTEEYDKRSASSIVNYRWKDFLIQEKALVPNEETISWYNSFAEKIYDKIVVSSLLIEEATQARDRLLPKLMSGEMEV